MSHRRKACPPRVYRGQRPAGLNEGERRRYEAGEYYGRVWCNACGDSATTAQLRAPCRKCTCGVYTRITNG